MFQHGKVPRHSLLHAGAGGLSNAALADTADKIWTGGPILTMNDAAMRAEAVAVKDGKILAVGSKDDVLKTKGEKTEDHRSRRPGAHSRLRRCAWSRLYGRHSGAVRKHAGAARRQCHRYCVAAADAQGVDGGQQGRSSTRSSSSSASATINSQLKELRHPTRDDLDAVSKEFAVVVVHQSGHFGAVNSKALEILGYTKDTPNPAGGVIQRKPTTAKSRTVCLRRQPVFGVVPKILRQYWASRHARAGQAGADMWTRYGYTTAQEGRSNRPSTASCEPSRMTASSRSMS